MTEIATLDRPPAGWFALDVSRKRSRSWDWVALMVDVDPDELKYCAIGEQRAPQRGDFPALFFVHPNDYRGGRTW